MIMKIAAMMDLGDDGEDDEPDDDEWENLKNGISKSAQQWDKASNTIKITKCIPAFVNDLFSLNTN